MATAPNQPTPAAGVTPAPPGGPPKELSGSQWVSRFPGSSKVTDLTQPFQSKFSAFQSAIKTAGGTVTVSATLRPPERAYLMHWCWQIVNKGTKPKDIPPMNGVAIEWVHGDDAKTLSAAKDMVNGYGMQTLKIAPALKSMHTIGEAVDMNVSWQGDLNIVEKAGTTKKITTTPRDGMNTDLAAVGKGYGVIKFYLGAVDKPHWSSDGK
ncbi:hypothetical protein [Undibacterium sp.]|uniref:hypothetical protein n=1 Tax=Undibacterium sp. TaxID=1914977 RepID=UPI00374D6FC0